MEGLHDVIMYKKVLNYMKKHVLSLQLKTQEQKSLEWVFAKLLTAHFLQLINLTHIITGTQVYVTITCPPKIVHMTRNQSTHTTLSYQSKSLYLILFSLNDLICFYELVTFSWISGNAVVVRCWVGDVKSLSVHPSVFQRKHSLEISLGNQCTKPMECSTLWASLVPWRKEET